MRDEKPLTPRERDIIFMKFERRFGDFEMFTRTEMANNGTAIRALSSSKARWEITTPSNILTVRRRPIREYTTKEVLKTIPGSYMGDEYKPGPYAHEPFRLWHAVRHGDLRVPSEFTLRWWMLGYSKGIEAHQHGLFAFRVPLYEHMVKELTNADTVSPMHTSTQAAIKYIENQSTITKRLKRPDWGPIYRSDRFRPTRKDVPEACAHGEPPELLGSERAGDLINYHTWLEDHPSKVAPIEVEDTKESLRMAKKLALGTHAPLFVIDYLPLIASYRNNPPGYTTQSVVFIRRISEHHQAEIIARMGWLALPDVIFYSQAPSTEQPRPPQTQREEKRGTIHEFYQTAPKRKEPTIDLSSSYVDTQPIQEPTQRQDLYDLSSSYVSTQQSPQQDYDMSSSYVSTPEQTTPTTGSTDTPYDFNEWEEEEKKEEGGGFLD